MGNALTESGGGSITFIKMERVVVAGTFGECADVRVRYRSG
jgi:hypothetical protein